MDDDDKRLIEYRDSLRGMHDRAWESFDRTLTALASGALAVSLVLVHDLTGGKIRVSVLIILTWCLFALSLCANLASQVTSASSAQVGIKQVDEDLARPSDERDSRRVFGGIWSGSTTALNYASAIGFAIGIATLLAFAVVNVSYMTGGGHG